MTVSSRTPGGATTVLTKTSDLQARVDRGDTIAEMAADLGLSESTVRRHCMSHGVILPKGRKGPKRQLPPIGELLARLQGGETPSSIAKKHKVTPTAVQNALARAGWRYVGEQLQPARARAFPAIEIVIFAMRSGATDTAWARWAGCDVGAVHDYLHDHFFDYADGRCTHALGRTHPSLPKQVAHVTDVELRIDGLAGKHGVAA